MISLSQLRPKCRGTAPSHSGQHPPYVLFLFYLCSTFVVLPFFDIPLLAISVTAPLMALVIFYALFQPVNPWGRRYLLWVCIAVTIWLAMVVSFVANGPWSEPRDLQGREVAHLIHYFYWLLVFIVSAYIAADSRIQWRLGSILGIAVVSLAGLRCFEAIAFGKIGAWTNPIFTTQNGYGVLFSTFTPFLFPALLSRSFLRKCLCTVGLSAVLLACAINGSRGSWICIAVATAVFFLMASIARPSTSLRLILPIGLAALTLLLMLASSSRVRGTVLDRFLTFRDLKMDKSYMIRETMNQRSWKLFLQSPIWGIGPGRYRQVYVPLEMPQVMANRSDTDFVRKSAHNSYLSFLAEGGLLATLPLAALLCFLAIRGGWAAIVLARRGAHWALGVYASFIAMSVHLWSLSGLTGTHAWFIYGLLAATLGVFRHIAKKTMDAPKSQHVIKPPAGLAPWHPSNGAYSLIFGRVHNFETARWSSSNQPLNKKSSWGYRKSSETWKSPLCTWVRR